MQYPIMEGHQDKPLTAFSLCNILLWLTDNQANGLQLVACSKHLPSQKENFTYLLNFIVRRTATLSSQLGKV
jgi:hypothetical protein